MNKYELHLTTSTIITSHDNSVGKFFFFFFEGLYFTKKNFIWKTSILKTRTIKLYSKVLATFSEMVEVLRPRKFIHKI